MVYLSTLVHGQRLRIWYSYGILHGWVKIACLSTIVVVEYYIIAEQQQSVQQSHRAGGFNSNLLVLYFIVVDLQVHTALQIYGHGIKSYNNVYKHYQQQVIEKCYPIVNLSLLMC